tara:strand:- start:127 stop:294 length:168 start_codon:yes stop_codon:yes gene_type:complete
MLSHTSLGNYYKTVFSMAQHHKYSIADIEDLLPYERDLYVDMLVDFIEDQKAQQK